MKNLKKILLSLAVSAFATSTSFAAVGNAKVVELGCHRLERLITLGKVDESFLKKLKTLDLVILSPAKPTDPSFQVTAAQYAGADGTTKKVEMMMDANGKAITQVIKEGTESDSTPEWGDKDAISLIEQSLHYVEEHTSEHIELRPFQVGLKSLTLMQVSNAQGIKVARIEMTSTATTQKLEVNLNENGSVEFTNIVNE
ncbi:hypothetical protein SHI21_19675 [Bacteriovorax sp. PP10]|uniref:Uncharacterized protein n=1 Tax=Bacteriovorax antarcticus TaxID=3088717 RepID=A0ABU5VZG2_9BACT|nr:hypothetical protein [Bacteriovorax sp. PP10]MEA9358466.1 hypothetical protein [Bacteriovorax sp. PP10]